MNDTGSSSATIDSELYPALAQCFFIIGTGYVAGQLNLLTNTQSTGLSRYISHFALPAVVLKNLVDLQFESVSWGFIASVFIAKAIVFLLTAVLTGIGERPRNFASVGLYSIMASQSNDFALILPIINAVYKQSHPDYERYIYLMAPISLVILNPIGFLLIELQKRFDIQQKRPDIKIGTRYQLITKVLRNIIRNPIVICTILGIMCNPIFSQHLPNILERILTPIAQSFSATALFYLGLTMAGKLRRLHTQLVVTVFVLCMIKLIIFPLVLRQAVFLLIKSTNGTSNDTMDYSNFGFLYGTAPTAPSVIFYVPESNAALQAVASTGLIVSTLLSGPIMIISAKMINLRTFDTALKLSYQTDLLKTSYDVSFISLFCTIIVLIGFFLRPNLLRKSVVHRYTLVFVVLQLIHAIWTISIQNITSPMSKTVSSVVDIGSILTALTTRAWITSISITLMITVCYSSQRAKQYFWVYHLFGWLSPVAATLIIYFGSTADRSKGESALDTEKFGPIQIMASIGLLAVCIVLTSINLLRFIRRTYRLRLDARETHHQSTPVNENLPLSNEDSQTRQRQVDRPPTPTDTDVFDEHEHLFRHAVLVGLLNVNAFVCISVLLWSVLAKNHDGVYYELQFLDTVLLHGQGIITFLVFALDADLLQPIYRKIMEALNSYVLKRRSFNSNKSKHHDIFLEFDHKIRPGFIQYITTKNESKTMETIFNENDFCQWLVINGHVGNEAKAHECYQELINRRYIICIDRIPDEQVKHWCAFTK